MAELNVSHKSISDFFKGMKGKTFIIPDYQRAYAWDMEKCDILWSDFISFEENRKNDEEKQYFLGTIVTCKNKSNKKEIEVIDGQQRITSLFLLLRAFYIKLENMKNQNDTTKYLKGRISPCLWETDELNNQPKEPKIIRIQSKVATENDTDILETILKNGETKDNNTHLYSQNYKNFENWIDQYATGEPLSFERLIITILDRCIILPIECEDEELALTIFSTLNDRGMQLSDSDIFKSKMYRNTEERKRKEFIRKWKELSELTERKLSINDLFKYYMHIIRAKEKNNKSEIALRKFYAESNYERLQETHILDDLLDLGKFWKAIELRENLKTKEEIVIINNEIKKWLHCLICYPNEYWKYIVSVFYYKNKKEQNFSEIFSPFLKKLLSFLFAKFIEKPTVNAIKDDIYNAYISVEKGEKINNFQEKIEFNTLKEKMNPNSRASKGLILLSAYLNPNQEELLPKTFHIEHILPKKWNHAYYNNFKREDANDYLEMFGNKIALEKRNNIQAGNKYFEEKKKNHYSKSNIEVVKKLTQYSDWNKENIEERDKKLKEDIINFFQKNINDPNF